LLTLNSCGGCGLNSTTTPVTTGTIRFIDGAPTAAAIDFQLGGGAGALVGVPYQNISTVPTVTADPATSTRTSRVQRPPS
jgi:hypothetical protein